MSKHPKEWFTDRIGKRVCRNEGFCNCEVCKVVEQHGLVINDKLHATYLFDMQNDCGIEYFDEPVNKTNQP